VYETYREAPQRVLLELRRGREIVVVVVKP